MSVSLKDHNSSLNQTNPKSENSTIAIETLDLSYDIVSFSQFTAYLNSLLISSPIGSEAW